jgi:hypothetical protein
MAINTPTGSQKETGGETVARAELGFLYKVLSFEV